MKNFTVKRIDRTTGNHAHETIYSADRVEAIFPQTNEGAFVPIKHFAYEVTEPSVFIDAGPGGDGFFFTRGEFYVMNESGRTVASYNLGDDKTHGNGVRRSS